MSILQKIGFIAMCLPTLFMGLTINHVRAGDPLEAPEVRNVTLDNPLRVNSIEELLVAILNIFMVLMIPIIVLFIILAGFKYVTAQGNPGQIEEATATFTYAIIGGVLILAAVAIAEIIRNTVDSFAA